MSTNYIYVNILVEIWKLSVYFNCINLGADAINIYGLLNTKKLGNFKNRML